MEQITVRKVGPPAWLAIFLCGCGDVGSSPAYVAKVTSFKYGVNGVRNAESISSRTWRPLRMYPWTSCHARVVTMVDWCTRRWSSRIGVPMEVTVVIRCARWCSKVMAENRARCGMGRRLGV